MKHKSKNKGKGFTETEREAQLSSQVFVLSELLDMTSTIIEELKLSILLDTITTKKRAVHRFRAGGKSSHRRRRLALGRF